MQMQESTPMERQVSTTMPRQVSTTSSTAGGAGKRRPSVTGDAGKRRPSVSDRSVPEEASKATERRPSTPSTAASSRRPSVASKNGAKEDHPEQKEKHKPFITEEEKKAVKQALEKLQEKEGTGMSRQTSGGNAGGRASSKERPGPGQRQSSKSRLPADRRRSIAKQKKECKQQNAVVVK